MPAKELSAKAFKRWLKQQSPNRRFRLHKFRTCPIGQFNKSRGRFHVPGFETPWVIDFINQIDKTGMYASPKKCLEILEKVTA